jgi:hypothetical protein
LNFALLSCPHSLEQIQEERPLLRWLPRNWLLELTGLFPVSLKGSIQVSNICGCLMSFPMLAGQTGQTYRKAVQAAKKIKTAGARVVGLETGLRNLAPFFVQLGLAVSQGSTMQVASAITFLLNFLGCGTRDIRALILNPSASPGAVCARLLAPKVRHLTLMGNFSAPLHRIARRILLETGTAPLVTNFNPRLLSLADLVIDLGGFDFNNLIMDKSAIIWQPYYFCRYSGAATLLNEVLLGLNTNLQVEGDLPAGVLRASTAEAVVHGLGIERIWPRNTTEVTVDQVNRVIGLANRIEMPIVGYVNRDRVLLLPSATGFDK